MNERHTLGKRRGRRVQTLNILDLESARNYLCSTGE